MKAAAVPMEILRAAGVRYLFGNPGTAALPFLDPLADSRPEYVVALQDAAGVAAAHRDAQLLAAGKAPLGIAGDGVARSGGVAELTALAELLGARVHGEPVYRRTNFPGNHPLWRGGLFPSPAGVRKALAEADVVLIVGA